MLRAISELKRVTIAATDGNLGSVSDVYFDDRSWAVRYLVVDAGGPLPDRPLFVPPMSVRASEPTALRLALSTREIEMCSLGSTQAGALESVCPTRAEDGPVHLQAATAVIGYAVRAEDGEIGHVKDVLVDDRTWAVRYLIVDTGHWWGGKTVLVSPGWFTRVGWDESKTLFCLVTTIGDSGAAAPPLPAARAHQGPVFTQPSDQAP